MNLLHLLLILTTAHPHVLVTAAQTCYYPNGDIASDDAPCSSSGAGICCPLNWQCMDNGLCYLENEDYYERHTCTDRSWPSDACPRICTQNQRAGGNEAILWCNQEDWCCDGNRSWNCCTTRGTEFFDLPDPHSIAFISVTPSARTPASSSSSLQVTGITISDDSNPSSSSSVAISTTTGANGLPSTIVTTLTAHPSGTENADAAQNSGKDDSQFGLTVGLAVGIPVLFGVCALLAFLFFRRRSQAKDGNNNTQRPKSPPMEANYQNIATGSHAPELGAYPIAAKRTNSGRYSELCGSDVNPDSPTPSTGTNTTSPPQYSPGQQCSPGQPSPGFNGVMERISEEPAELWGGYVPYRPPQIGHDQGYGVQRDERIASGS